MRSIRRSATALLALSAVLTFGSVALAAPKPATAFQFSTLPALSAGLFEGGMTFGDLLKHGNFGLGTFDALDGELIILDGKAYRATPGGPVTAVDKKATTPFAVVTAFKPDQTLQVTEPADYPALQKQIRAAFPTANTAYAIAISGTFERIKVRSVRGQNKPYPTLSEVTKTQTVSEWTDVRGTLVGFCYPAFLSGVNLPDLHFHFITDDRKMGGHMLDCGLKSGTIRVQSLRGFDIQLPATPNFDRANLSTDLGAAWKAAETAGGK